MNIEKKTKINYLLTNWPLGLIMTSSELLSLGYSYQLVNKYVNSHWLKSVGQGAYVKLNDTPTIYGILNAIEQSALLIHLGGISALEYHGYAQYSTLSEDSTYFIYGSGSNLKKLPHWISGLTTHLNFINKQLFPSDIGIEERDNNGVLFKISRPERAILEVLALVPDRFSFKFASENLENLQLLDADLVQHLLEECSSIKVKRLFLYLSEEKGLPCFKKLSLSNVELGRGKRVIGTGGIYIPKYGISVPKDDFEEGIADV